MKRWLVWGGIPSIGRYSLFMFLLTGVPYPLHGDPQMNQIRFKTNEFQMFTATRTFALGQPSVTIARGTDLEFDGASLRYAGAVYPAPQLRGAISSGWIVPTGEFDENDASYGAPVSANIKMRPPTDNGPSKPVAPVTAEADERIVMSSVDHAANTRDNNRGNAAAKETYRSSTGGADFQEGVPVRTLKTAAGERAKSARTVLTAESAGSVLRAADNVQIDPGAGLSEEMMLSRMPEEEREMYLARKESLKSRYVDSPKAVQYVDTKPATVGQIKTAGTKESEGIKLTQQVGGGIEVADPTGLGGKAKTSTLVEDGITFKNTNGPVKTKPEAHPRATQKDVSMDGTVEARRKIAKAICPDFPDTYDFSASDRKKLARLQADFEDRPDILRAVFAAESDAFKAKLVEEFPTAFA